jgi:phosphoheptose isomerase
MSLSEPVADVGGLDASLLRAQLRAELEQRQDSMVHVFAALSGELDAMTRIAETVVQTLRSGGKVLVAGNGGSADIRFRIWREA